MFFENLNLQKKKKANFVTLCHSYARVKMIKSYESGQSPEQPAAGNWLILLSVLAVCRAVRETARTCTGYLHLLPDNSVGGGQSY